MSLLVDGAGWVVGELDEEQKGEYSLDVIMLFILVCGSSIITRHQTLPYCCLHQLPFQDSGWRLFEVNIKDLSLLSSIVMQRSQKRIKIFALK